MVPEIDESVEIARPEHELGRRLLDPDSALVNVQADRTQILGDINNIKEDRADVPDAISVLPSPRKMMQQWKGLDWGTISTLEDRHLRVDLRTIHVLVEVDHDRVTRREIDIEREMGGW